MEKKKWVQPELIVLVRSKPEESVLQACKLAFQEQQAGWGSSDENQGCTYKSGGCSACAEMFGS